MTLGTFNPLKKVYMKKKIELYNISPTNNQKINKNCHLLAKITTKRNNLYKVLLEVNLIN